MSNDDSAADTGAEVEQVDSTEHTGNISGNDSDSGGHPAWKEILDVLPESLHSVVTPALQKWDSGVNARLETVQSPYKPYQEFVDNKIDPQTIQASLAMAQMIDSDPRSFYDKMTEYYGSEWGFEEDDQGQPDDANEDGAGEEYEDSYEDDPRLQQLQEQQDTIAKFLAEQVEEQERMEAEKEIDSQLNEVADKYGTSGEGQGSVRSTDERVILSLAMQNNQSIPEAAEFYYTSVKQPVPAAAGAGAPRVVSPGGGVPAQHIDPRKMSSEDTRSLVAEILAKAHTED